MLCAHVAWPSWLAARGLRASGSRCREAGEACSHSCRRTCGGDAAGRAAASEREGTWTDGGRPPGGVDFCGLLCRASAGAAQALATRLTTARMDTTTATRHSTSARERNTNRLAAAARCVERRRTPAFCFREAAMDMDGVPGNAATATGRRDEPGAEYDTRDRADASLREPEKGLADARFRLLFCILNRVDIPTPAEY